MAGLRLVSWDATMLDVADSDANTAAFITSRNRRDVGAFAKVRLMTLIEVGTHAVIDAVFGAESEQVLAGRLLDALTPGMLLLGDRNFPSWKLWGQTAASAGWVATSSRAVTVPPLLAKRSTRPGAERLDQQVQVGGLLLGAGRVVGAPVDAFAAVEAARIIGDHRTVGGR